MTRRAALVACAVLAFCLVVARSVPFMVPGVRLDADQAVVGLMAKHISEGRAFPVYFYGQSYLLAVEAYLAAPLMWVLGPTEVALKLPLLLMNAAAVVLLLRHLVADAGLHPTLALTATLPLALAPVVPGVRLMDATGGNVEPVFYAALLWALRTKRAFGLVLGLCLAHREMAFYGAAALALLELVSRRRDPMGWVRRWLLVAVAVVAVQVGVRAVRPYGAQYGPGTQPDGSTPDLSSFGAIGAGVCLSPQAWPHRAHELVTAHLPYLVGGVPGPMLDAGVNSGMGQGNPGLAWWVGALVAVGLTVATMGRRWRSPAPSPGDRGHLLPHYLMLVGGFSTSTYAFALCSAITPATLRYDLAVLLVPVGAIAIALRPPAPTLRAGVVTATLMWTGLTAGDYLALAREIRAGHWPDWRGDAMVALEARGLTRLWGDDRLSYVLSFRSAERLIVAPIGVHRIHEYARLVRGAGDMPLVVQGRCEGGQPLVPTIRLCPPPPVEARPLY